MTNYSLIITYDEAELAETNKNLLQLYIDQTEEALQELQKAIELSNSADIYAPIKEQDIQGIILVPNSKYLGIIIETYNKGTIPETPILVYSTKQLQVIKDFLLEKIKNAYYFLKNSGN